MNNSMLLVSVNGLRIQLREKISSFVVWDAAAPIDYVLSDAAIWLVEISSWTELISCSMGNGVDYVFLFVIFYRPSRFCEIFTDKVGEFDFFSGRVF